MKTHISLIMLLTLLVSGFIFSKNPERAVQVPYLDGTSSRPIESAALNKNGGQGTGIEVALGNELFIRTASEYLLGQQDLAGGFPWTAGGGIFSNTQGTTARGMLLAYLLTKDVDYLNSAIANGDWYLVNHTTYSDGDPRFDTHTPNFLEQLSAVTGDPQYATFVQTYFWDKLASGTYGETNDLDAADFGALVVNARNSQGIVALSPWDLSATVIAAHLAGETAIRDALMASGVLYGLESTTATDVTYDVIGLAGAVWASGVTGIDLDPTTGRYAAANSTADLVTELLSLTLTSNLGAWLWGSAADPTDVTNADLQTTAFAIMALHEFNRAAYLDHIAAGAAFIRSLEESSGEFLSYPTAPSGSAGGVESHAEALTALCTVAPSDTYVDDDWAGSGFGDVVGGDKVFGFDGFSTVMGGIDGVSASTVHVAPGTYVEQVEIDKNLTLIGAGSTSIIQSPGVLTGFFTTSANNYPIIWAHDASDIIIRDLVVDGAGLGNANYRFVGIGYDNAGGTVDNVEIKGIRNTPIDGSQHGVAILANSEELTARSLAIENCNIHDFQKNGMTLNGSDLTATVTNNTVTGAGAVNFIAQNGIQVSFGATGSVIGNTVSGFSYTPFTFVSTGMLIYQPSGTITIDDNNVVDAQVGIYFIEAEGSITNNEYTGSLAGIGTYFWGIVVDPGDVPRITPSLFDAPAGSSKYGANPPAALMSLTTNVDNNTLTGDGSNGVGLEIDALGTQTLDVTVTGNNIQEFEYGMVLYKADGAGLTTMILRNVIANNSTGIEVAYTNTTASVIEAYENCIFNNALFGLNSYAPAVDATGNWWGAVSGPFHSSNPSGTGNAVSDFVAFDPWSPFKLPACGGVIVPHPYVFLADKYIDITQQKNSEGEIHANRSIEFHTGKKPHSLHTGNLTAVEDIEISKYNKIVGTAKAGGDVENDGQITGGYTSGANVAVVEIPEVPYFTPGSNNITVKKNKTLSLDPGDYKKVEVEKGGTLILKSGVYNLYELEMGKSSTLAIEIVDNDPVTINVKYDIYFSKYVEMTITPANSPTVLVNFQVSKGEEVTISDGSVVFGSFIAPEAAVELGKEVFFKGGICAESIVAGKNTQFVHHSSTLSLPKVVPSNDEGDDELLAGVPTDYELSQNYPNPFNPTTAIRFAVPEAGRVSLKIYNVRGQLVKTLADGYFEAGHHNIQWDATNDFGEKVASGFYFYRIQAADFYQVKKMLLLK